MAKVRLQTPPNTIAQPDVNLRKNDFDAAIWQKGYNVIIEKAYRCPCKSQGGDNLSSCRNCAGTGWFFINPTKTKLVLQGMNFDDKYKQWSQELIGQVKITAMEKDRLTWMDRITSEDTESYFSEVLHPQNVPNDASGFDMVAATAYAVLEIEDLFAFRGVNDKHVRLSNDQYEYSAKGYYITITDPAIAEMQDLTLSVRYKYNPQFHVIDIPRDVMSSQEVDQNTDLKKMSKFPLHAIGRRAHYVLDKQDQEGNYMINNSYEENDSN